MHTYNQSDFWRIICIAAVLTMALVICGCQSPNTGVSTDVGDITAFPEISDATDNISVKVLYLMTGARVWTAKDSNVTVEYRNVYTNDYIGIFHTRGVQDLAVKVEPVCVDTSCATNSVP